MGSSFYMNSGLSQALQPCEKSGVAAPAPRRFMVDAEASPFRLDFLGGDGYFYNI